MSHYTAYVITKTNNHEELDKLMLPYNEYECTGITDYCIHINETKDAITEYANNKNDYESLEAFLDSWYCIKPDCIFAEEPTEKPQESYAVVKDGQILQVYDFTNPNRKWDYYTPFEWTNCAILKKGAIYEDAMTVKKSQLDMEQFMKDRKNYYIALYRKLKPFFKPDFISWRRACKNYPETASDVYNKQQTITDMTLNIGSEEMFHIRWNINIDNIATMTEEEFVDSNLREEAPFWAMVLPTGEWIEHGKMGWFAISYDEDKNFNKTWMEIWKTIPDDCYVWRCDCHI